MKHKIDFSATLYLTDEEKAALDAAIAEAQPTSPGWTCHDELASAIGARIFDLVNERWRQGRLAGQPPIADDESWPAVEVPEWLRNLQNDAGPAGPEEG